MKFESYLLTNNLHFELDKIKFHKPFRYCGDRKLVQHMLTVTSNKLTIT